MGQPLTKHHRRALNLLTADRTTSSRILWLRGYGIPGWPDAWPLILRVGHLTTLPSDDRAVLAFSVRQRREGGRNRRIAGETGGIDVGSKMRRDLGSARARALYLDSGPSCLAPIDRPLSVDAGVAVKFDFPAAGQLHHNANLPGECVDLPFPRKPVAHRPVRRQMSKRAAIDEGQRHCPIHVEDEVERDIWAAAFHPNVLGTLRPSQPPVLTHQHFLEDC